MPGPGIGTREGAVLLEEKINLIVAKLIKGSSVSLKGPAQTQEQQSKPGP